MNCSQLNTIDKINQAVASMLQWCKVDIGPMQSTPKQLVNDINANPDEIFDLLIRFRAPGGELIACGAPENEYAQLTFRAEIKRSRMLDEDAHVLKQLDRKRDGRGKNANIIYFGRNGVRSWIHTYEQANAIGTAIASVSKLTYTGFEIEGAICHLRFDDILPVSS